MGKLDRPVEQPGSRSWVKRDDDAHHSRSKRLDDAVRDRTEHQTSNPHTDFGEETLLVIMRVIWSRVFAKVRIQIEESSILRRGCVKLHGVLAQNAPA